VLAAAGGAAFAAAIACRAPQMSQSRASAYAGSMKVTLGSSRPTEAVIVD
jgi:hypothetical protein